MKLMKSQTFEPLTGEEETEPTVTAGSVAQHRVFGEFTGTAIPDNGKKVNVKGFPGFAEDVYNRW